MNCEVFIGMEPCTACGGDGLNPIISDVFDRRDRGEMSDADFAEATKEFTCRPCHGTGKVAIFEIPF